jgi:hypothetical protein
LREKKAGKLKNAAKITLKIRTFSHPQDIWKTGSNSGMEDMNLGKRTIRYPGNVFRMRIPFFHASGRRVWYLENAAPLSRSSYQHSPPPPTPTLDPSSGLAHSKSEVLLQINNMIWIKQTIQKPTFYQWQYC